VGKGCWLKAGRYVGFFGVHFLRAGAASAGGVGASGSAAGRGADSGGVTDGVGLFEEGDFGCHFLRSVGDALVGG
jgi:hypothetical protein